MSLLHIHVIIKKPLYIQTYIHTGVHVYTNSKRKSNYIEIFKNKHISLLQRDFLSTFQTQFIPLFKYILYLYKCDCFIHKISQ